MPMAPATRIELIAASTIVIAIAVASEMPAIPQVRWSGVLPLATRTVCMRKNSVQVKKRAPWTCRIGAPVNVPVATLAQ